MFGLKTGWFSSVNLLGKLPTKLFFLRFLFGYLPGVEGVIFLHRPDVCWAQSVVFSNPPDECENQVQVPAL